MSRSMLKFVPLAVLASAVLLSLPVPASAAEAFTPTVAGQAAGTTLGALASSSTLPVTVSGLPATVGAYALHCEVPSDPRAMPTRCDGSAASAALLMPGTTSSTIRVNGEFFGVNPDPTAPPAPGASVDCRVSACAVYMLGSGKDSANPAYIRTWATSFSPVRAARRTDAASFKSAGKALSSPVKLTSGQKLAITTRSGLPVTVYTAGCSWQDGVISGDPGRCVLTVTTTGGASFKPLVTRKVVTLS